MRSSASAVSLALLWDSILPVGLPILVPHERGSWGVERGCFCELHDLQLRPLDEFGLKSLDCWRVMISALGADEGCAGPDSEYGTARGIQFDPTNLPTISLAAFGRPIRLAFVCMALNRAESANSRSSL
jgi:hypothetical protein